MFYSSCNFSIRCETLLSVVYLPYFRLYKMYNYVNQVSLSVFSWFFPKTTTSRNRPLCRVSKVVAYEGFRLRVVPHFSSGTVEGAKRERAWKSPNARLFLSTTIPLSHYPWGKMGDYSKSMRELTVWINYKPESFLSSSQTAMTADFPTLPLAPTLAWKRYPFRVEPPRIGHLTIIRRRRS